MAFVQLQCCAAEQSLVIDTLRVQFSNFKAVALPEPSLFMLVLGREGSSWDEMGM